MEYVRLGNSKLNVPHDLSGVMAVNKPATSYDTTIVI